MNNKYIEERFKEIINNDKFICTENEFDAFQNYGYLLPFGKLYLTRLGQKIEVNIIKQVINKLDINLSELIEKSILTSEENNFKRVYCMSRVTFNKYLKKGYIIEKNNKKYYRLFEDELWLVIIL